MGVVAVDNAPKVPGIIDIAKLLGDHHAEDVGQSDTGGEAFDSQQGDQSTVVQHQVHDNEKYAAGQGTNFHQT